METTNLWPVLGLLVLAVAVVVVLLRVMRAWHRAHEGRREDAGPAEEAAPSTLSKEEQDYLDSSHIRGPIAPGGRDALDTRAEHWRNNKRK